MERKLLRSSRFISALVIAGTVFSISFGFSSAGALTVPGRVLKFDPGSLKLPPATPGQPYNWVLKEFPTLNGATASYRCIPYKLFDSIQLAKDCRITGIAINPSKKSITKSVSFEIYDVPTGYTIKSGSTKFTVLGSVMAPPAPVPNPIPSIITNQDTTLSHSVPQPQPNPQPWKTGDSYWQIGIWRSPTPIALTIKVGPFAVGPATCTISGVISTTLVLKIVDNSIPGDIKGVSPATSSDFKVVRINNDCGQAAFASSAFRTATDRLVGNVDFVPSGSQFLMKLSVAGISSDLGKFDQQESSLTGHFEIPALTDANGNNISIVSDNFTYKFDS